ncbi:MAG: hypothetical protein FJW30_16320 [Acidobacteria bacterium]|nr:hypothetical protein [Acidobacteriota bacterium]
MNEEHNHYPEGCSRDGSDCTDCIGATAASLISITRDVTPQWAERTFRKIYRHSACQLMEHTFIWSCTQPTEESLA